MKKKNPQPPEDWPSQAKALFSEYAGQLMQRTRSAHGTLQLLEWFLCYQESLGLSFREFSAVMLGDYLEKHGPYLQLSYAEHPKYGLNLRTRGGGLSEDGHGREDSKSPALYASRTCSSPGAG